MIQRIFYSLKPSPLQPSDPQVSWVPDLPPVKLDWQNLIWFRVEYTFVGCFLGAILCMVWDDDDVIQRCQRDNDSEE